MPLFPGACGNISCVFGRQRGHLSQRSTDKGWSVMDSLMGQTWIKATPKRSFNFRSNSPWNPSMPSNMSLGIGNNTYNDTHSLGSLVPEATQKWKLASTDAVQHYILALSNDICSFSPQITWEEVSLSLRCLTTVAQSSFLTTLLKCIFLSSHAPVLQILSSHCT